MSIKILGGNITMETEEDIAIVQEELLKMAKNLHAYTARDNDGETSFELDIEHQLHEKFRAFNYQEDLKDCESYEYAVHDNKVDSYMGTLTGEKLIKPKKGYLRFANMVIDFHEGLVAQVKEMISK